MQKSPESAPPLHHDGNPITVEDINEVLANEGYSADQRKGWLKEVLTELTSRNRDDAPGRDHLVAHIKAILNDNQDGEPIAEEAI
ncbi:MAG: hypothetical protein GC189_10225 [Alphaproteobacteria bacterium]|nr:hypothetical protein [Alphaproteobacteria bacterium]